MSITLAEKLSSIATLPPEKRTYKDIVEFRVAVADWMQPLENALLELRREIKDLAQGKYSVEKPLDVHKLGNLHVDAYKLSPDRISARPGQKISLFIGFTKDTNNKEDHRYFAEASIKPLKNASVHAAISTIAQELVRQFPERLSEITDISKRVLEAYPLPPMQPSLISRAWKFVTGKGGQQPEAAQSAAPAPRP